MLSLGPYNFRNRLSKKPRTLVQHFALQRRRLFLKTFLNATERGTIVSNLYAWAGSVAFPNPQFTPSIYLTFMSPNVTLRLTLGDIGGL